MQYIELTMCNVKGNLQTLREFLSAEAGTGKNDEDNLKEGERGEFELYVRVSAADDANAARLELWYYDDDCEPHFLAQGRIEPKAMKAAGEMLLQYHAVTDEIASDVWEQNKDSVTEP